MTEMNNNVLDQAREEALSVPLDEIHLGEAHRFESNTHWPFFDRVRREAPVHFCPESEFGPYWSIMRWDDIMTAETSHKALSSADGIFIGDRAADFVPRSFITSDEPLHGTWRKPTMPAVGPQRLQELQTLVRERVGKILDDLPRNETFNWVELVSIELTTQMLATLFDFPWEDRRLLTFWSDTVTNTDQMGYASISAEERQKILMECAAYFQELWTERAKAEPRHDFISLLAHHPDTKDLNEAPLDLLGNLMLLIVGGNDTTRNSISGGLNALNENPDQYDRLRAGGMDLVPNMVSEIIRWQTPLAHMRRRAIEDCEIGGKQIRTGDKVIMWYVSGNRDDAKFTEPYKFRIERDNARNHISFGFGIHRCMGNRVAEMQLRILWEEILKRFDRIDVVGEAKRTRSNFVMGFEDLPVKIAA
ncbi:MAG: cytochrome P450 [Hyphomicrobiaceae bacterium]